MAESDEFDEAIGKARRKPSRLRLGRFRRSTVEAAEEGSPGGSAGEEATPEPEFDPQPAHKVFSVEGFNSAWDLIEKANRSDAETEEMISLAHASAWHWTRRDDVRPKNLAISAWQLSRVYAEAARYEESEHYANLSLEIATGGDVGPVFTGYAYEALARLAQEKGEDEQRDAWLTLARAEADKVDDKLDRNQLLGDLEDLG